MSGDRPDRRQHQRISIRRSATLIVDGAEYIGALLDLSETGAMVALPSLIDLPQTTLHVSFTVPPKTYCECTGHIIRHRCTSAGWTLGINFGLCNTAFYHFLKNVKVASQEDLLRFIGDLRDIRIEF